MPLNKSSFYLLLCMGLFVSVEPAIAEPVAVLAVNQVRQAAGLEPLEEAQPLNDAALAHALYLRRYMPPGSELQASAHEERSGLAEFSGRFAPDRALRFAYPHSQVTENVSMGNPDIKASIDDLMSAIYHRFAFLDFSIDEIGAANVAQRYVFNMGKRKLAQTCLQQPEAAKPIRPFNCLGTRIKSASIDKMCANLPLRAKFDQPFSSRCADGTLLDRRYMEQVCQTPPEQAILKGSGRYYSLCPGGKPIDARWFDALCAAPPTEAAYAHSGRIYQICTPEVPVYAEWFEQYCASVDESDRYPDTGGYYEMCGNGFHISSEYYDQLEHEKWLSQPLSVVWPADGVTGIKPVFYSEEPHPTPDLAMTGYPISIQFNPGLVDSAIITGFSLERFEADDISDWHAVQDFRSIDQRNDINQRFTALEFAWFPLQRLEWGAKYRYRIDALVDGVVRQFKAEFETDRLNLPVYKIYGGQNSMVAAARHFVLYRPPDSYDSLPFQGVSLRYRNHPFVEANVIDSNTVEIRAGGRGCSPVILSTRLGEEIQINFCSKAKWLNLF